MIEDFLMNLFYFPPLVKRKKDVRFTGKVTETHTDILTHRQLKR